MGFGAKSQSWGKVVGGKKNFFDGKPGPLKKRRFTNPFGVP